MQAVPELDSLLANGPGGLDAWWEAFKNKAADVNPAFKGILDRVDFIGSNQNSAVLTTASSRSFRSGSMSSAPRRQ